MSRVTTRSLLVDSAIALVLGWMCWSAAKFHWGWDGDPVEVGPPGRGGRGGPPPWFFDRPEVADWVLVPVLVMVAGLACAGSGRGPAFVADRWSGSAATWPPGRCSRRSS